jgi:hypothetical protein
MTDNATPSQEKLFTCSEKDMGRHVRLRSTGEIGIVRKDPGNGWVHPGVVYEWKGYIDDLEYVDVTPSRTDQQATIQSATLSRMCLPHHLAGMSQSEIIKTARWAQLEIDRLQATVASRPDAQDHEPGA